MPEMTLGSTEDFGIIMTPMMLKLDANSKSTERDKLIGKSILKADEYVKPFDLESLLKLIAESLQRNKPGKSEVLANRLSTH